MIKFKNYVEIFGKKFYLGEYQLIIEALPPHYYEDGTPDLSDVKGLERMTSLEGLTLELGGITKIERLQDLIHLEVLNLSHNISRIYKP